MTKLIKFLLVPVILLVGLTWTAIAAPPAQEPSGVQSASDQLTPTPTPAPPSDPITPQVVGGTIAAPGAWPWQVAIASASETNPFYGQFCGGTLIDPEWVLTAAHCVVEDGSVSSPTDIDVVLGINKLSMGYTYGTSGQRIDVAQIIPHPSYNEFTGDSDIALLHLARPATLGPTVRTIGLIGPSNSALVAPGTIATVTGWGNMLGQPNPGGYNWPDDLYQASVPIISNATCNSPMSYNGQITGNMLCAGYAGGGTDSCQGDSGGPLVVSNGTGGWLLAGVVSWGDGCAQPNLYGVYTRVSQFKGWVNLKVNGLNSTVYLPLIMRTPPVSGCAIGESNNIADALTVSSGQTVCGQIGQVGNTTDAGDVYKIYVAANQRLTISMNGTGSGDADLYLFPPGATDVYYDVYSASSDNLGNSEFIQGTLIRPVREA